MRYFRKYIHIPVLRLYERLLWFYPTRFRAEFTAEMQDIFSKVMLEAEERGGAWLLKTYLREVTALLISISRERWHELRSRKEKAMDQEVGLPESQSAAGGSLQIARAPSLRWIGGWTLLTSAVIPAALLAMIPIAAILLWFIDLGVKAGLWPSNKVDILTGIGFITALSLIMAATQWFLLRNYLPRSGWWFKATAGGLFLGGLVAGASMTWAIGSNVILGWYEAALLLPFGLALGLAQWLYLRRLLPNAAWIILVDAPKGVLTRTRRHTYLASLLGIPHVVGVAEGTSPARYYTGAEKVRVKLLAVPGTLRLTGAPLRLLQRVVGLESALPLLAVSAIAMGTAFAASAMFLTSQMHYDLVSPGIAYYALVAGGLAAALGVIASTLPLLRRITGPEAARNG